MLRIMPTEPTSGKPDTGGSRSPNSNQEAARKCNGGGFSKVLE